MALFRNAVLASALAAAGLVGTTGMAFAADGDGNGSGNGLEGRGDNSLVNAEGAQALNQPSLCENQLDVLNVLPIHDPNLNADIPLLNKTGDGNDTSKVPNGKNACTPESKSGAVGSSDSSTDDAAEGVKSTGTDRR